jgi:predicted Rossmann fold flavoprotein
MSKVIVVIGAGAAGFFGAVTAAKANSGAKVVLLEKAKVGLSKVRISGGGRCNVTHSCFDPAELVKNYPRGGKELLGPFHHFQPKNTIEWFSERGVALKVEEDGRMFPITDSSETIIECLQEEVHKTGVDIRWKSSIEKIEKKENGFEICFTTGEKLECDKILLATGSNKEGHLLAESLGHAIVSPVPSLFTFNIPGSPLNELAGISVDPVALKIEGTNLKQQGPMLITHFGFSGPAALKLSAWGARILHDKGYQAKLLVNWLPKYTQESLIAHFLKMKKEHAAQSIAQVNPASIAKQLWKALLDRMKLDSTTKMKDIPNKQLIQFAELLQSDGYHIDGKTTYKQEFVTSGGVALNEVNFKTMESRKCPGLYFAGEVLDVDAVTGGFNFQNAWTTAWIAGTSIIN